MQQKNEHKGSKTLDVMTFKMAQPSLIEASAGTGKTYTITNLVLRALLGVGNKEYCLERPLEIDEFLIVTFTNAATSDLRARIYERIRAARTCIEEFINYVLVYLNNQEDLSSEGLVKNPRKVKDKLLIKVKSKSADGPHNWSVHDYSDQELQDLLLEINVEATLAKIGIRDQIFIEIIKDLLDRNIVPLRQAALVLVRAERKINQAAVSTIHSFCNSTLTQIYALESGEAFNTELKNDLSEVNKEAYNQVWRRLFYQEHSSQQLLNYLGFNNPISFSNLIKDLDSVRLSSSKMGFYGFQIYEWEQYFQDHGCSIDVNEALEPQLMSFIEQLDVTVDNYNQAVVERSLSFYQHFNENDLAAYFAPDAQEGGAKFIQGKKPFKISATSGKKFTSALYQYLALIKELAQQTDKESREYRYLVNNLVSSYNTLVDFKCDSPEFASKILLKDALAQPDNMAIFNELITNICSLFMSSDDAVNADKEFYDRSAAMLRILVAILMSQESDAKCKELHVMSNDDVLRRLDYALNQRGKLGDSLAWAIRARYPLAMIDEFQDTDPVQFNIFTKIYLNKAAIEQKAYCYLIGDPKQSIYAFRGSDINSYLKAKERIKKLTQGQGLYTLDTNYRSSPDVVDGTNALFDTSLNEHNYNPFDEANIRFSPVFSGKGKQLLSSLKGKKKQAPLMRDFILEGIDQYLLSAQELSSSPDSSVQTEGNDLSADNDQAAGLDESAANHGKVAGHGKIAGQVQASVQANKLNFQGNANTYVVSLGDDFETVAKLRAAYAKSAAWLVQQILKQGYIVKNGQKCPVKSGDIAILVRSSTENNAVQQELWNLQIPSVYFSDTSSVLTTQYYAGGNKVTEVSREARELKYFMEAMCDCKSHKKLHRLLGCQMLALNTEEFNNKTSNEALENEVVILSKCAKTWEEYGFLPAFLQWANDPSHNMEARLLELKDGERAYTNYCHISEIVQKIHTQKVGIQSQLHWYSNLLDNSQDDLDQDETKKRLESEQDQVKILTIHKSKGLEFPVVLMPFLWSYNSESHSKNQIVDSVKYYVADKTYEHVVLDLDVERHHAVDLELPIVDAEGHDTGKSGHFTWHTSSAGIKDSEDSKEDTRLLYVAVTRARYANFIFVGDKKDAGNGKDKSKPRSLTQLHGSHDLLYVGSEDHRILGTPGSLESLRSSTFVQAVSNNPSVFTVIDGKKLLDDLAQEQEERAEQSFAPLLFNLSDDELGAYDRRSLNVSSCDDLQSVPSFAQSFLYKGAIDKSFNIISYTSLTVGSRDGVALQLADDDDLDKSSADDSSSSTVLIGDNDSAAVSEVASKSKGRKRARAKDKSQGSLTGMSFNNSALLLDKEPVNSNYEHTVDNLSWSYQVQSNWLNDTYYDVSNALQPWADCSNKLSDKFPRGANAGIFMHAVLEEIEFERLKELGFKNYIHDQVINAMIENSRYSSLIRSISHNREENQLRLAHWFNDVLEAPIIAGQNHCFALADLKAGCYEREMRFLMSNEKFTTAQIDVICRQVAQRMLPEELSNIANSLTLTNAELKGYIKGSIDLACRFDLNDSLKLRERDDLAHMLAPEVCQSLSAGIDSLRSHRFTKNSKLENYDLELFTNASFEQLAEHKKQKLGSNYKYYVIDYKSNYLGPDPEDYDEQHMLSAIYMHRYDVQFMIYTLALYRHLKRRCAVPFDASYETLKQFYDEHVGGVVYLFLRGMKANYQRDRISKGVFATKLDFDVVHQLDLLFSVGQSDSALNSNAKP